MWDILFFPYLIWGIKILWNSRKCSIRACGPRHIYPYLPAFARSVNLSFYTYRVPIQAVSVVLAMALVSTSLLASYSLSSWKLAEHLTLAHNGMVRNLILTWA